MNGVEEVARGLADEARKLGQRVRAVELEWGHSSYDQEAQISRHELDVCAIVDGPGWVDSRYRAVVLTSLPAALASERDRARAVARALAAALDVELDVPPLDRAGAEGSRWIARQGAGPEQTYGVSWQVAHWSDAGDKRSSEGAGSYPGRSGREACWNAERVLHTRFGAPRSSALVRTWIPGLGHGDGSMTGAAAPAGTPPVEVVRGWRRDGRRPSEIVAALLEGAPGLTPLALMRAFEVAFDLPLDALTGIAAFRRDAASAGALDAALAPPIEEMRRRWNLAHELREADRAGALGPFLRARKRSGDTLYVIQALREVYDLGLQEAARAFDLDDADTDAEVEARVREAIARRARPA